MHCLACFCGGQGLPDYAQEAGADGKGAKVAPLCIQEFIDSWGWQSFGDDQVKGLIRLTKEAALTALRSSGCWANGVSLFFPALDWSQVDDSETLPSLWMDMEEGEEAKAYVQRVRKEAACHALHGGGGRLAIRLDQLDPRILPQKAAWHLRARQARTGCATTSRRCCWQRPLKRNCYDVASLWEFRGLRQDFRNFVPIELEAGDDAEKGAMVLEAVRVQRRRRQGDVKALPPERIAKFGAVDIAELVKQVATPKRRSRSARSKSDQPPRPSRTWTWTVRRWMMGLRWARNGRQRRGGTKGMQPSRPSRPQNVRRNRWSFPMGRLLTPMPGVGTASSIMLSSLNLVGIIFSLRTALWPPGLSSTIASRSARLAPGPDGWSCMRLVLHRI